MQVHEHSANPHAAGAWKEPYFKAIPLYDRGWIDQLTSRQALNKHYRIVARGLKDGYSAEQAAALLAGLLKRSADEVKPLLRGRSIVVKKRLSIEDATKYQTALERCGCVAEIEDEPEPAPQKALSADELERMNAYAKQILDTVSKELGSPAAYDMRAVEWLANNLSTKREKYTGELGNKVAKLYGAFLGTVLIETCADALPVWVRSREGVGIHFRKPNGRMMTVVFPGARVLKHIEHGEEYSILAFMRAQQRFLTEQPAKKPAPVRKNASDGTAPPTQLRIDDTVDGQPLTIVIPHTLCCNCGTSKQIHSIESVLSKQRYDGSDLSVIVELPFCVPCVPSADRVKPNLVLATVMAVLHRPSAPQTSYYQPVSVSTLNDSPEGIATIGFGFSNPLYAKEFARANKEEFDKGRLI
jgi:hypothetical protein